MKYKSIYEYLLYNIYSTEKLETNIKPYVTNKIFMYVVFKKYVLIKNKYEYL